MPFGYSSLVGNWVKSGCCVQSGFPNWAVQLKRYIWSQESVPPCSHFFETTAGRFVVWMVWGRDLPSFPGDTDPWATRPQYMPGAAREPGSTHHLLLDAWLPGLGDRQVPERFLWRLCRRGRVPTVQSGLLGASRYGDLSWGGAGVRALRGGAEDTLSHQERQDQPWSLFSPITQHFSHG